MSLEEELVEGRLAKIAPPLKKFPLELSSDEEGGDSMQEDGEGAEVLLIDD